MIVLLITVIIITIKINVDQHCETTLMALLPRMLISDNNRDVEQIKILYEKTQTIVSILSAPYFVFVLKVEPISRRGLEHLPQNFFFLLFYRIRRKWKKCFIILLPLLFCYLYFLSAIDESFIESKNPIIQKKNLADLSKH